jgi:hypothetical protein
MDRNQLQPVNGSTHVAIVGTYNKIIGLVKHGPNIMERIDKAIRHAHGFHDNQLDVKGYALNIDYKKQIATEIIDGSRFQHKYPFKLEQVTEY